MNEAWVDVSMSYGDVWFILIGSAVVVLWFAWWVGKEGDGNE